MIFKKDNKPVKLHLACGPNIVNGWDNIDILKEKGIINHDLRKPLPYKDDSVDAIFHEHFIEHLEKVDGENFLRDCYRVLKVGAAMKMGWPDLKKLIDAYNKKDKKYKNYVTPFLDHHVFGTWDETASDCLFDWEHRYAYTADHMTALLKHIGFSRVKIMAYQKSDFGIMIDVRNDPATTYLECVK